MQVLRIFPPVIFDGPHTFTLEEFCEWVGISWTKAYAEIKAGRLTPLKIERRIFIHQDEAERWIGSRPREPISQD